MKKMKAIYLFLKILTSIFISHTLAAQPSIGGYKVYFGHLHDHSIVSDGSGTPDEAYNYAKNTSHLDFFSLSDHSDGSGFIDGTEWTATQTAANKYNEPGLFTAFRGFEWTSLPYGHITVINSDNYCNAEVPAMTFTGMCNWLSSRECIAFFNHPGYGDYPETEFNNFSTTPTSKIVGMELWNGIDKFDVYYYNDGYYTNDGNKGYFDEALARNWKIGALGNDDNHAGTWGSRNDYRMAIMAYANTREDLYNALKARRFYSTLDKNLALSFTINGNEMGSTVLPGSYGLHILASDGNGELFTQVQLLKNGSVINTWMPNLTAPDITLNLTVSNYDYFYIRVKQTDGDEAISSPIWISDGNQLPVVSITSPVPGNLFTAPATVTINASATDADGIAKVDFYYESSLLTSDNTAPYSYTATNVSAGSYIITAKATDNTGVTTTSAPVTIVVVSNQPPVVSITSPVQGAIFTPPASVTINSTAADADGTITKVEFYQGSTLLGSDNTIPYSFTWTNVAAGSYSITARATDNTGVVTTSTPVAITVGAANKPPVVSITSPVPGNFFTAPATVTITASATDVDGTIAKVDFYYEGSLLVSDNTSPYSYTATNVSVGSYTVTAKATDNAGAATTSAPVTIVVVTNQTPVVSITSPVSGAIFTAGASVTINATATDADGTITKVEFYRGSTLIGSDNTTPYSYIWTNVAAGSYSLTAKATDNTGATTTSAPVAITVGSNNQPPVVSITSPLSGAIFTLPASVTINATATDADGTITKVEFYQGSTLLGSDNTTPYSYTWTNVAAGSYSLTAKATDNTGATTTSAPIAITVGSNNQPPVVSITSPLSGAIFAPPASVTINVTATDADGSITNVEFYQGSTLLGSDNTTPYSFTWANVAAGNYSLTAKATDNTGATTTSAPIAITVGSNNQPPVVSITSPLSGAIFAPPASVTINATATDADGTITKVEFYQGSTLLGSDNTTPYSYTWANVAAGNYFLTAKATDNTGALTTSTAVNIVVNPASGDYTFTKRIQSGSDDVEESMSGSVILNSDDIELVYDNSSTGNQIVGLRFNGITVPKAAVVKSAFLQFTADELDLGTCKLTLKGENTANAQPFASTTKNVSNRTKTTASVSWNPAIWFSGSSGASQKSPDLKTIVQEIINSAAWNSGNSMVFIITGTGTRTAESYEGSASKAAMLTITYSIPVIITTEKSGILVIPVDSDNIQIPIKSGNLKTPENETLVKSPNLVCYPVPFKDQLYIKFTPVEGESIATIEIFNAVGKCILNSLNNETEIVVEIPDLKPGIYFVRVRTNKGVYNKSVIKQ